MSLKIHVTTAAPTDTTADLLVVGVFHGKLKTSPELGAFRSVFGEALLDAVKQEEFSGKKDQRLTLATLGHLPSPHLLVAGLGNAEKLSDADLRLYGAAAGKAALKAKASSLAVTLPASIDVERARFVAEGVVLGAYHFSKYLTGERLPKRELATVTLLFDASRKKQQEKAQRAVAVGLAIGEAITLTRNLQNEPPNELTPVALADAAVRVAKKRKLDVTVLDRRGLERAGAHLFVAVARGSRNEPRLVHLVYKPAKKAKRRIALVGKGLTFDSGGLCIKPAAGMGDMKSDMSGAANVIGVMDALPTLAPNVEVHGIIGCAENMPDGDAYRPGDVFPSMDGKTVEIINTDAEGRLVLADCLTYARRVEPDLIVNNATLTGACVVALGQNCSGFYSTDDAIAQSFTESAQQAGEQFWRLPLLDDLRETMKSDIADMKHTGDRYGGSITAALFLREFVGSTPFVHCDIAGPSFASRATGSTRREAPATVS